MRTSRLFFRLIGGTIFTAVLLSFPTAASGQEKIVPASAESVIGKFVVVRTEGGGEFSGILLTAAPDRLELADGEGRIVSIHRPSILAIAVYDRNRFFRDAAENRLIVMPTAFPIERGQVHVTSQEIVSVTLSLGLTEHVSAWGGISIPGALGSLRASASTAAGAVSLGTFAGATWAEPQACAVLPYAIYSAGKPDGNATAAIALPLVFPMDGSPYVGGILAAAGGKTALSRTAALVTEAWFLFGSDYGGWDGFDLHCFPAAVFRIAGDRLSWDVGVLVPARFSDRDGKLRFGGIMDGPVVPLPILSVVYRLR